MEKYNALWLAAVGALLYFTGWAYLYTYFSYFGISLIEINPSIQFVFMHSLAPWYFWWEKLYWREVLLFAAIYIIIVLLMRELLSWRRPHNWSRPLADNVSLAVVVLVALFIASLFIATSAGKARAADTWVHPSMSAFLKFKDTSYGKKDSLFYDLAKMNDDFALKYLFSTSDMHYVFHRSSSCKEPSCGLVLKIPVQLINEVVIITR